MTRQILARCAVLMAFILLGTGCYFTPTTPVTGSRVQGSATPHASAPTAYPASSATPYGPVFMLTQPLLVGAEQVEGLGPAEVPILIVDVSESGSVLGQGTVGSDGTFSVAVSPPLQKSHLIAIALGDLSGTDLDAEDFRSGPGYRDMPMIGTLFDMVVVEEAE